MEKLPSKTIRARPEPTELVNRESNGHQRTRTFVHLALGTMRVLLGSLVVSMLSCPVSSSFGHGLACRGVAGTRGIKGKPGKPGQLKRLACGSVNTQLSKFFAGRSFLQH